MKDHNFQDGVTYKINHHRKGALTIHVNSHDETWIYSTLIDGTPKYASQMSHRSCVGDPFTFRASLVTITEKVGND